MTPPPPSPPLNSSRRHRTLQVDNGKGDTDRRRIRPELPAKLKPHASKTNSTSVPSNAVFKTPDLPPRLGATAQVGVTNAQAWTGAPQHSSSVISDQSLTRARIDGLLPRSAAPSIDHTDPKASQSVVDGAGGGSEGASTGQQPAGANLPADNTKDNIAKDLGCQNEAELELHQRVNKHVNAYMKKACGIPGGYRLYTERQAWNVLSILEPLDLATNPEVFEPLETDQLAKFLNHRRKSLEEFQQSKMPMPPLPLLPSTTSLTFRTDKQRENADLSIQWGLQGIVNRGKWTITQADVAMIKSELIHLQKARKRYDRSPSTLLLSPPPDEGIEVILSRVAIRKTTRYSHLASQEANALTNGNGFPALQPPKNSVKEFREIKKFYELLPVDDAPDEMETLLGPDKLKVTDVCKMSLSITQEEIGMVKEELQQVAARKRISREQRMRNAVLSASWEESCGELPIDLNMKQYCLSPPIAPLPKTTATKQAPLMDVLRDTNIASTAYLPRSSGNKGHSNPSAQAIMATPNLLDVVEPLSPSFSNQRYMLNSDTPTLAASSSSIDEDTSSLPSSPTRPGTRAAKESYNSVLQYQGPAIESWEEEKMEIPLLPRRKCDYLDSSSFRESLPTLFASHSLFPISSSPEDEVPQPLTEASESRADRLLDDLLRHRVHRVGKAELQAVDLPGFTSSMPQYGTRSDYMKVPNLPSMTQPDPCRKAVHMPQSLKDFISVENMQQIGVIASCKGVQSLAYELGWSTSMEGPSDLSASNLLSQPPLSSTRLSPLPTSLRCHEVQECLLRPPSPPAVVEYAICQVERSITLQSQHISKDQPASNLPCQASPLSFSSSMSTDVYDPTTASHGIAKKQRTGTADETRIAHPAKALDVETHAQWQAPNREARPPRQRAYDLAEMDLDNLVCGISPVGINGPAVGEQAFMLPSAPISRYMLAREPASRRNHPRPTTSSSGAAWRNVEEGDTPSPTVPSAPKVTCESANPLQYDNPKSDSRPSNSPDISFAVELVIGAAKTLPVLPIMASTNIYNKRHLCSALNELQFQLYGHDQLEADFIMNLKTACIVVPLAYIVANAEKLLDKLAVLACTFESLIVVFDLYPSRTNSLSQAALPDPWTPSTQVAFSQFEGRLKRHIMLRVAKQSGFQHNINVYLSDNVITLAALLRLHANLDSMPEGTSVYRQLEGNNINDTFDWLSMDMEAEECLIRDGLQLNSAAALYIAHEYGTAAFLDACQSRPNDMELIELLGPWNMQTTGNVVRTRAAEAKKRKDEKGVEDSQSQLEDDSPTISPERQLYGIIRGDGCRQIFDGSPIALASNGNSSYCTDFEADIAVDQDLQVGGHHVIDRCPAYYQDLRPAFDTAEASSDEADELNLSTFEWS